VAREAKLFEVDVTIKVCDGGAAEEGAYSASTHTADTAHQAGTDASGSPLQLPQPTRQLGRLA